MVDSIAKTDALISIEMLVIDVDGVLTDGRLFYGDAGNDSKCFHVRDGSAIKFWLASGKKAAIISGRTSRAVERRAQELGIPHVTQGAGEKLPAFRRLLEETRTSADRVCVIGDDLPDLPLVRNCGLGIAVADACPELRGAARIITKLPGGHGAVREVIEMLLKAQGLWNPLVDCYLSQRL